MIQLWRYCEHIDAERNIEALADIWRFVVGILARKKNSSTI